MTRGTTPEELNKRLEWQTGPELLKWPEGDWPMRMTSKKTSSVTEDIRKLRRKAFSAAATRAQLRERASQNDPDGKTDAGDQCKPEQSPQLDSRPTSAKQKKRWSVALVNLVGPQQFSSLTKLCGTIAWTRQAVQVWLRKRKTPDLLKWEASGSVLSTKERAAAFQDLALTAQDEVEFHDLTLNRLVAYRDESKELLLCGGRIQSWGENGRVGPLIPFCSWLATLLIREAHESNHEGVAATLLHTRKRAWIIQGRRTAKKIVNNCVTCRKWKGMMC